MYLIITNPFGLYVKTDIQGHFKIQKQQYVRFNYDIVHYISYLLAFEMYPLSYFLNNLQNYDP